MREKWSSFERAAGEAWSSQKGQFKEKARMWREHSENHLKTQRSQQVTGRWREQAGGWVSLGVYRVMGDEHTVDNR